jgi:hypothetical protein
MPQKNFFDIIVPLGEFRDDLIQLIPDLLFAMGHHTCDDVGASILIARNERPD